MTKAYPSQFAKENNVNIAIVLIYVDDLIIMGDDLKEVTWIYETLLIRFEMKGLGELKHFLSLEIDHCDKGVFLYQYCHNPIFTSGFSRTSARKTRQPGLSRFDSRGVWLHLRTLKT